MNELKYKKVANLSFEMANYAYENKLRVSYKEALDFVSKEFGELAKFEVMIKNFNKCFKIPLCSSSFPYETYEWKGFCGTSEEHFLYHNELISLFERAELKDRSSKSVLKILKDMKKKSGLHVEEYQNSIIERYNKVSQNFLIKLTEYLESKKEGIEKKIYKEVVEDNSLIKFTSYDKQLEFIELVNRDKIYSRRDIKFSTLFNSIENEFGELAKFYLLIQMFNARTTNSALYGYLSFISTVDTMYFCNELILHKQLVSLFKRTELNDNISKKVFKILDDFIYLVERNAEGVFSDQYCEVAEEFMEIVEAYIANPKNCCVNDNSTNEL